MAAKVRLIRSDVDFGVYGRFLLAASAKTRYVYIVDDDVAFPVSIVSQYIGHIKKEPGVWGHAGHVRNSDPDRARWVDRPRKPVIVDYANAGWFLETQWITRAFLREPPLSWLTGEDMHLSYMIQKVLGLETRVVGWRRDKHPQSRYKLGMTDQTTLTPSIWSFRSFLVRAQLGRGKVMRQPLPLDVLVYVDTGRQAQQFVRALKSCSTLDQDPTQSRSSLCSLRDRLLSGRGFRVALLYSGLQAADELRSLESASEQVCLRLSSPACSFVPHELCGAVCQEMRFATVTSVNLDLRKLIAGSAEGHVSRASLAADAIEATAALLTSLSLTALIMPEEDSLVGRSVLHAAWLHNEEPPLPARSGDRSSSRPFEILRLPDLT
eukprot:TRINITY_DN12863_c3_g1_i1.p1 TRINITY_DN12863_c3_g1~~TRINITY_DN12863_c3_g1_i1.p1  ORF type:complete len:428 (+),score=64.51 TRINITY_DN12863_c3_g1_i1:145-1284(+)